MRMSKPYTGQRTYTSEKGNFYLVTNDPTNPGYEYHMKLTRCAYCNEYVGYKYPYGKVPASDPNYPHNTKLIVQFPNEGDIVMKVHPYPCAKKNGDPPSESSTSSPSPRTAGSGAPTATLASPLQLVASMKLSFNECVDALQRIGEKIDQLEAKLA
jgi:hypothetical protein